MRLLHGMGVPASELRGMGVAVGELEERQGKRSERPGGRAQEHGGSGGKQQRLLWPQAPPAPAAAPPAVDAPGHPAAAGRSPKPAVVTAVPPLPAAQASSSAAATAAADGQAPETVGAEHYALSKEGDAAEASATREAVEPMCEELTLAYAAVVVPESDVEPPEGGGGVEAPLALLSAMCDALLRAGSGRAAAVEAVSAVLLHARDLGHTGLRHVEREPEVRRLVPAKTFASWLEGCRRVGEQANALACTLAGDMH